MSVAEVTVADSLSTLRQIFVGQTPPPLPFLKSIGPLQPPSPLSAAVRENSICRGNLADVDRYTEEKKGIHKTECQQDIGCYNVFLCRSIYRIPDT